MAGFCRTTRRGIGPKMAPKDIECQTFPHPLKYGHHLKFCCLTGCQGASTKCPGNRPNKKQNSWCQQKDMNYMQPKNKKQTKAQISSCFPSYNLIGQGEPNWFQLTFALHFMIWPYSCLGIWFRKWIDDNGFRGSLWLENFTTSEWFSVCLFLKGISLKIEAYHSKASNWLVSSFKCTEQYGLCLAYIQTNILHLFWFSRYLC